MASGDTKINSDGETLVDDDGNEKVEGDTDPCCCDTQPPDDCSDVDDCACLDDDYKVSVENYEPSCNPTATNSPADIFECRLFAETGSSPLDCRWQAGVGCNNGFGVVICANTEGGATQIHCEIIDGTAYWVCEIYFLFDGTGGSGVCVGDVDNCAEGFDGYAKWRTPILTPTHCPPEDDTWVLFETGGLESDPVLTVEIF